MSVKETDPRMRKKRNFRYSQGSTCLTKIFLHQKDTDCSPGAWESGKQNQPVISTKSFPGFMKIVNRPCLMKIMIFGDPFPTEFGVGASMPFTERFAFLCSFVSGKGDAQQKLREADSLID